MSLELSYHSTLKSGKKVVTGALMCGLVVLATACGGGDKDSTPTSAATATATAASSDSSNGESSGVAVATGTGQTTIEGAKLWEASDGSASMEVSPEWTEATFQGALGAFTIGEPNAGFQTNVNVVNEAADVSVAKYVEVSIANTSKFGELEVIDSGTKKGPNGSEIGWIEYQGHINAAPDTELHFLAVCSSADGHVSTATFTALPDQFDALVGDVRPYLETIQAH